MIPGWVNERLSRARRTPLPAASDDWRGATVRRNRCTKTLGLLKGAAALLAAPLLVSAKS